MKLKNVFKKVLYSFQKYSCIQCVKNILNKSNVLTSINVSMRLVGSQEHGLSRLQNHIIQEVNGEAADVSWILGVEAQQELPVAAGRVLSCCSCRYEGGGQGSEIQLPPDGTTFKI